MKEWIKNLFVGPDGDSDEIAVIVILITLTFIGTTIYQFIIKDHPWNVQDWGIGAGAAIGAIAAAMGYKNGKEKQ